MATTRRLNTSNKSEAPSKVQKTTEEKKIEALEKRLNEMATLLEKSMSSNEDTESLANKSRDDDYVNDEENKVSGDDYIKVMSLCPYVLNLRTERNPKNGKVYTFNSFGEVKRIQYRDLVKIIETHPTFTNDGVFIIINSKVIRRHALDESYESVLEKENIEKILSGNQTDAVNIFKTANDRQKNIIADMIVDKIVNNHGIDLNLVYRLSQEAGYDIHEKAKNIIAMMESVKSEND